MGSEAHVPYDLYTALYRCEVSAESLLFSEWCACMNRAVMIGMKDRTSSHEAYQRGLCNAAVDLKEEELEVEFNKHR